MLLWYIASADWFIRTSTADVCVNLPPNFKQAPGYPHMSGQKKMLPKVAVCATKLHMLIDLMEA